MTIENRSKELRNGVLVYSATGKPVFPDTHMRTYIELRRDGRVTDWRVILDSEDATTEAVAEKVRALTWRGMHVGDTIVVYESKMTAEELKLR